MPLFISGGKIRQKLVEWESIQKIFAVEPYDYPLLIICVERAQNGAQGQKELLLPCSHKYVIKMSFLFLVHINWHVIGTPDNLACNSCKLINGCHALTSMSLRFRFLLYIEWYIRVGYPLG